MRGTCTVPRCEAVEIVNLTKAIGEAALAILAHGEDHNAPHLAEIASAALYIRLQIEQAITKADEKANGARAEGEMTS